MHFKNDLQQILKDRIILSLILCGALQQIVLQIFYQFWQMFCVEKQVKSLYFGAIYVVFQLAALCSNFLFSKLEDKKVRRLGVFFSLAIATLIIASVFFFKGPFFIAGFSIAQMLILIYTFSVDIEIQRRVNAAVLSSVISFCGTFATIVGVGTMWASAVLLKFFSLSKTVLYLVAVYVVLSLVLSVAMIGRDPGKKPRG